MSGTSPHPHMHERILPYNYVPTEYVCAIFVAMFGLSTLVHAVQAVYFRIWWLWPTVILAGIAEIIGWSARLWSSKSPFLLEPFEMQIATTIIAPTPLIAANFVILGIIINLLGTRFSRLGPRWYTIIFCTFDIVSLIVQAVGGASAAFAVNTGKSPNKGGHIMLGGIIFQLVSLCIYLAFATEFFWRYFNDRPLREASEYDPHVEEKKETAQEIRPELNPRLKAMICALLLGATFLFIRSIYRTIELADGWEGRIIATQAFFNVLDGMMITLALFTLNFAHPGWLLQVLPKNRNKGVTPQPNNSMEDTGTLTNATPIPHKV